MPKFSLKSGIFIIDQIHLFIILCFEVPIISVQFCLFASLLFPWNFTLFVIKNYFIGKNILMLIELCYTFTVSSNINDEKDRVIKYVLISFKWHKIIRKVICYPLSMNLAPSKWVSYWQTALEGGLCDWSY